MLEAVVVLTEERVPSMKVRSVALAAVAVAVGVVLGQTVLAHAAPSSRYLTAYASDGVRFPALDLFCNGTRRDPDGIEAGPILFCQRASTNHSRAVVISRFHYAITRPDATISYRVARSP